MSNSKSFEQKRLREIVWKDKLESLDDAGFQKQGLILIKEKTITAKFTIFLLSIWDYDNKSIYQRLLFFPLFDSPIAPYRLFAFIFAIKSKKSNPWVTLKRLELEIEADDEDAADDDWGGGGCGDDQWRYFSSWRAALDLASREASIRHDRAMWDDRTWPVRRK